MQPPAPLAVFEPVSARVTVADSVYGQLRDALAVGRFDPGQTLTIGALSEIFGTSHMPVREALRRLAAEGALDIGSNGSARVPPVDRARLDDLSETRILLERRAVMLAARRMGAGDVEEIAQLARMHAAVASDHDITATLLRNRTFHFAIYRQSGSLVLPPLIDSLWLQYGPYMGMLSKHVAAGTAGEGQEPYTLGHIRIVEALRARDAEQAAREIESDIRRTQSQIDILLRAEGL